MADLSVREALVQGRRAVARGLALGPTTGPEPDEETLTWLLLSSAAWSTRLLTVRRFTRTEESRLTGADWLWWWEGQSDAWFGCLVQAKCLRAGANGVTFDAAYRPRPTRISPAPPRQIDRLLEAADRLEVPAAYMLYRSPVLGLPPSWRCPQVPVDWLTGAVTFVAAAVIHEWLSVGFPPDYQFTRPVECLACEGTCGSDHPRLAWYARNLADPDLRSILMAPPTTAAQRAFRGLFNGVAEVRSTQFLASTPATSDMMHSGFRPGAHFARGVRPPPDYVVGALTGDLDRYDDLPPDVAGVVVVRDD